MSLIRKLLPENLPESGEGIINALREALQSLALLALWRGRFFEQAAFYGDTSLRILYGLDRYSEDLDFSLLQPSSDFSLRNYENFLRNEFNAFGLNLTFSVRQRSSERAIESAFLKTNTYECMLNIETPAEIINTIHPGSLLKIKLEIDTNPPPEFNTEIKYVFRPFQYAIRSYTLPSMFAGKIHAMLYRKWKSRVKGRDWYDFAWFVSIGSSVNLKHLEERMKQTGHYNSDRPLTSGNLKEMLIDAVDKLDLDQARKEVAPFVDNPSSLEIWSKDFFREAVRQIMAEHHK